MIYCTFEPLVAWFLDTTLFFLSSVTNPPFFIFFSLSSLNCLFSFLFIYFYFYLFQFALRHMYSLERERGRGKVRNHPPGEMATPLFLLLHSFLGIWGMHAHAPGVIFKPPGLGLELQSTMWESSASATIPLSTSLLYAISDCVYGHLIELYMMIQNRLEFLIW